ncbi:MAG: phosphohydrolase, partial [Desulfobacterales bacterium]|nr:phosphohydrolase [Desulfobacterales bacterium]
MNVIDIIRKFYPAHGKAHRILLEHGRLVAEKSLAAAQRVSHLAPDLEFIREAAMLHDIGVFMVDAPGLGCVGKRPYIVHGVLGRELLEEIGLPRHALVCERHVGVGISAEDIKKHDLPLPERDMLP